MKALVGAWDNRPYPMLAEITALRTRVVELEQALAQCQEENATLRAQLHQLREDAEAPADVEVAAADLRTGDGEIEVALTTS